MLSVKLGGDFNLVPDRWTLRAGVYYETAAAPSAYANVDFPAGAQLGGALGASLLLHRWEVALTYQLRYQPSCHRRGGGRPRLPADTWRLLHRPLHRSERL